MISQKYKEMLMTPDFAAQSNKKYGRCLEFYTDGAYSSKSEMGGWAAVCIEDGEVIDTQSGYEPYTTNNRMELMAFVNVFNSINTIATGHTEVIVYTDSAYIANCFNQGWYRNWMKNGWRTSDRQEVKNQDLLRPLVASYLKNKDKFKIKIVKVQSHSGNRWNDYVDILAVKKRKELE